MSGYIFPVLYITLLDYIIGPLAYIFIYFYLNIVISQDILLSTCSCNTTSNTLSI